VERTLPLFACVASARDVLMCVEMHAPGGKLLRGSFKVVLDNGRELSDELGAEGLERRLSLDDAKGVAVVVPK